MVHMSLALVDVHVNIVTLTGWPCMLLHDVYVGVDVYIWGSGFAVEVNPKLL